MATKKNIVAPADEVTKEVSDRPAGTLLKAWGARMAKGKAQVIPVYVGGSWILNVPRGNKRVLRVVVPGAK